MHQFCDAGIAIYNPDKLDGEIAWETEVWVANAPSYLIHFNGERFLGPYNFPE
jgi:BsuBI/PstI restriction endonuclease domain